MAVFGAVVLIVIVVFTMVVGPCPVAEPELHCASAGSPEQVKVIVGEKPVEAVMPTLVVADPPGDEMVAVAGPGNHGTMAKPGCTANVIGAVLLLGLKLGSPL